MNIGINTQFNGTTTNGHTSGLSNGTTTNGHTSGLSNGATTNGHTNGLSNGATTNGHTNGLSNGATTNGHTNGLSNGATTNGHTNGLSNGHAKAVNGHTNATKDDSATKAGFEEPIAICGMAMRLPGGIREDEAFWDVLVNGKDMKTAIPADRWNADGFGSKLGKRGAIKTQHAYFLDDDLSCLDASFFSMTKSELEKTDPQQRQMLEVTRECLENAGEVDYRGKPIGCYVGTFGEDWLHSIAKEPQTTGFSGSGDLMIANRVSYEFDFKGPSLVVKTGCSASLVGLHAACRALQSGDCSAAIVAGTSLIMGPYLTGAMTNVGVLSPEGSCKTFDSDADGFARAEAINAIYIKRLDEAIRDGNPIRAVIRGVLSNSDGKSASLMAPNGDSHEELMRNVYAAAGLDPRETGFVECHGTGTPTGDPIEATAIGNIFGERGAYIGSVKPNIGHAEGASGLNSVIKSVLALEHKIIPPNIKFNNPNPKIPFAEKKLTVPLKPTPWPKDRAERISVNSFGIGGTNAHVIIDSASQVRPALLAPAVDNRTSTSPQLVLVSANTQESLKKQVANVQQYVSSHPDRVVDIAYTLAQRREHLPHRSFFLAGKDIEATDAAPSAKIAANPAAIAMVFSGQGAQWPEMGADLIKTDPKFRGDIQEMDKILKSLIHPPLWTIEEELLKPSQTSQLDKAYLAQPLCTAVQIGLVNALSRSGVQPSAVVGHSSGEIGAAYAAGALSCFEALVTAYYRGYVTTQQTLVGGMAAIGLGSGDVLDFLVDGVVVACENSPSSTTISGDLDQLKKVIATIKQQKPDVLARELKVDMAYHSHHMKTVLPKYLSFLEEVKAKGITRNQLRVPLYSSVTSKVIDNSALLTPEYWGANLTSPVRFRSAVSRLLQDQKQNIFLEIGPHATLAGPLRQICAEVRLPCTYIPTMLRSKNTAQSLMSAFGLLYQQGNNLDLKALVPTGTVVGDLPAYPWDHSQSFWYESRVAKDWRLRQYGHHAILGQRIPESTSFSPSWRVLLDLEDEPWLMDHKVGEDVVFPFAGYVTMAGEAIRQITGVKAGYSVRHVVAHTALVLTDSKPVEVVTTLSRHKLTDSADSEAYSFSISSYSGTTWIKHCDGRVMPKEKDILKTTEIKQLPRQVRVARWYEIMARVGLVYGPEFQGITSLTSSATEYKAVGEITNTQSRQDAPFLFHPATIDSCLQMVLAALAQAAGRNFTQLCVPTLIEELDISRSATTMTAEAWSTDDGSDVGLDCVADGRVALRLRGARLSPLDDEKSIVSADRHAAARLEWYPDFDFMDIPPLFTPPVAGNDIKRLLEELALICLLDSHERLQGLQTEQPHFLKFRDWLAREKERAGSGDYPVVQNASSYLDLTHAERVKGMKDRMNILSTTESIGLVATGIMRICENAEGLFTGSVDTLDLLMKDNVLTEIYNAVSFGFGDFIHMLSVTKPNLRILEVGAGTGGTTELILRDLARAGGNPAYSTYCFTDISAGFFAQAKERFSYAPNMDYKVFDISQDPFEQGFERESYDIILAPNVVHATASLNETLKNLQPLLRPHGHLVLSEVCALARAPGYVFGNFSGWWLGEADNRKWEPYIMPERWDAELKAAGFTGTDTVVYDAEKPFQYCAAIVSQPQLKSSTAEDRPVSILCSKPNEGITLKLVEELKKGGISVSTTAFGESLPEDRDIISTLDLESRFFENISEKNFVAFQDILREYKDQKLLWLMPPTQVGCQDPRSGQTVGTFRVARAELAIPIHTLEIDLSEKNFTDLIMKVFQKVRTREDNDKIAPDKEYAVENGVIKIGRYQPFSLEEEVGERGSSASGNAKALTIGKPGLLDTLSWVEECIPALQDNQVEIEVRAVGLNFRDIMVAMGVLKFGNKTVSLGLELTGVVSKIGSKVSNVAVGDRVCGVAMEGCFSTYAVLLDTLVVKIPDSLSFEEGATMPACYTTAVQALIDVGQMKKGQTVLIHSACGGIGHAAIDLCRMVGAEIYCTVGNADKVKYLVEKLKVPRERIFNSRNDSFLADVMAATDGQGVDIVLNSLSGELLHASWKCVAEFGKLVELGKRDLVGYGKLDLEPFLQNRSYCCVDLAHAMKKRPETVGATMERWVQMFSEGLVVPIPMTVFEAADISAGFRHLQKGDHVGKAVIRIPTDKSEIPSTLQAKPFSLDPEASYLLTGGLGGLGRSVATWMVERGARNLIFLSRSAGKGEHDKTFFTELESMGCEITTIQGKANDIEAVKIVARKATKPVKGIFHLAMVLRDAPVLDLTYEEWTETVAPKVEGAWNLHNTFKDSNLDFFVMTSSLVTLIDQPGQGNYAAANTFLESFTQYRHRLGLPASVLGVCPVDDIGFVAENPLIRRKLKSQGLYFLPEREILDYMELAILNSHPSKAVRTVTGNDNVASWKSSGHIVMGLRSEVHLSHPDCQTSWRRDRRMGMFHNISEETGGDASTQNSNALRSFLSRAALDPEILGETSSAEYLASEIGVRIFRFMMKEEEDIDISMTLGQIGMDSLMAIELRRWWKQTFGLDISVLEIMNSGTLIGLGKTACEELKKKVESK